ncbi:MAG TPA: arsenic resistance N-acetyltransferase ArsN2 [Burkholderiales bacterium]|nr:arsenic resistance N-acetyltransferase ArsN2 [Burkholderiales bacterium]
MTAALTMRQAPHAAAVTRLLAEAKLPSSDLTEAHLQNFLACGADDKLKGVVGLELYQPVALLRSLAVASRARGRGVGSALLAEAESYARSREVKEIYLLTTTAERFFAGRGYERIQREAAPEAIRETHEFSSLCPASAAVMRKRL